MYNGDNTALHTSANMLLDNSYLSGMHTNGDNEGSENDDSWADNWGSKPLRKIKKISKYRPGSLVPNPANGPEYDKSVPESQQPKFLLSDSDYVKRILFHKEKMLQIDSMCKWKKKDFKGMKKKIYINEIQKKNHTIL